MQIRSGHSEVIKRVDRPMGPDGGCHRRGLATPQIVRARTKLIATQTPRYNVQVTNSVLTIDFIYTNIKRKICMFVTNKFKNN